MKRKKYKLTLNRVKAKPAKNRKRHLEFDSDIPSHSTPVKKYRIEEENEALKQHVISPLSPIKEVPGNHHDISDNCYSNTTFDYDSYQTDSLKCDSSDSDIPITTKNCVHDFSFDSMCEKCGLFCAKSKPSVTFVSDKTNITKELHCDNKKCDNELCSLLTTAERKLKEKGQPDFLLMLLSVIASGRLDIDSLTFSILSETIMALNVDSLTQQRYSWKSKCFWKLFMTKCGGMAIRLLSGWKGIGTLLTEETTPGFINSELTDIILAIPNEDILRNFDPYDGDWPTKLEPGFCEKLASPLAERVRDTSICLSLDGKKLTPGLKGDKGDINLLGKEEDGLPLKKKLELFESEQAQIKSYKTQITSSQSTDDPSRFVTMFEWAMTHLSQQAISLQEELKKKDYTLEKLKKMGGEDYLTSRYCFAIQQVIASQVEIRESLVTGQKLRDKLTRLLAAMHGKQFLLLETPVDLQNTPNYCALHDIDELLNSNEDICKKLATFIQDQGLHAVKQRSSIWFARRKEVVATGSTLHAATGANGLKEQREHFLQAVLGKEPKEFSTEVKIAMEHGQKTEAHAIATFCTRFLPSLLPDHVLYETGGVPLQTGGIDILVSPDGFLLNTKTGQIDAVLEVKCPFTADLHTSLPKRYYLQVQAEIYALDVQYAFFMSYKGETARIFKISRDEETWKLATLCLQETFGSKSNRIPSRLTQSSKLLTEKIKHAVQKHCTLVAEVSAVTNKESETSDIHIGIPFSSHINPEPFLTDISDMHSLFDKTEAINIVEVLHAQNSKVHQIMRKKATELVTLVASDTYRIWSKNQSPGVPVSYFLKGYSLSMSVMRSILEDTLDKLYAYEIHVPCIAFDGQFMKLLREDGEGQPQTLLQLQKGFWQRVCKMSKSALVSEIKRACDILSKDDIQSHHLTKENGSSYVSLERAGQQHLPRTSIRHLNNSPCKDVNESECADNMMLADNTDEDTTEDVLRLDEEIQSSTNMEGQSSFQSEENIARLLDELSMDHDAWKNKSVDDLNSIFSNCQELAKLKISELKVVARFLKQRLDFNISPAGSKVELMKKLKCLLGIEGDLSYTRRRKSPLSLKNLVTKKLHSNKYPKLALSVSYANWKFPEVVKDWQEHSKVKHGMVIPEVDSMKMLNWFYIPTSSKSRNHQLEVMKIDPHHLLTRHRSAICKGDLGNAQRNHFIDISKENSTALKAGMMEQQLNMQSTDYAKITFSSKVQEMMHLQGYHDSAHMCKLVREWFEACDDPGLEAVERCQRKLRYKDYLMSLVNLSAFPPPGSHIKGYPLPLWEATVASIDADFFLYAITKRRTYNNRSLSSQPCESLYSCLATMPGAKNGVPSAVDLEINMAKICGECIVRQDPTRGFSTRLSSAPVYPQVLMEKGVGRLSEAKKPPTHISEICIKVTPTFICKQKLGYEP